LDEPFSISIGERGGYQVVVVRGELDELTAPELDKAIEAGSNLPVIVDLGHVVFISSAGLHVLLRERPNRIQIVCPPGNVVRLFEIVRANRRVQIFESLDAALSAANVPCVA
jgi:anti-anti-sigma factor